MENEYDETLETEEQPSSSNDENLEEEESQELSDDELYQQELERIRKEKAATRAAYTARQEDKGKTTETETETDPILERLERIEKGLDERFTAFEKTQNATKETELISKYAKSENEAALIRHHLENSIRPSGDLKTDIENAAALANRHKLTSLQNEIKRSKQSNETAGTNVAGDVKPKPQAKQPPLDPQEASMVQKMRAMGYKAKL